MIGGHLVHEREVRHRGVHELDRDVHPCPRADPARLPASAGSGNGSTLSQYGMVRKVGAAASRLCRWVVPVRGSPAMTTGGSSSMSWISGCRVSRSVSSSRFLSNCSSCA